MDKVEVEIIGKPLKQNEVGSVLAVTRSQAKLLVAMKRARLHIVAEQEKPKRVYRRRDMKAAE